MRLESVRDLKAELKESGVLPSEVAKALGVSARSVPLVARLDRVHTRSPDANVVAFGVAPGKSKRDFRLGVRIQVAERVKASRMAEHFRSVSRGESDVRIVPKVRKRPAPSWFRKRHRPLEAGLSIAHHRVTAGTLGFIVEDEHAYYALSNNHVLADVNSAQPGDPVVQPGPVDMKVSKKSLVGVLDRFVPISFRRANLVDCAVAELLDDLEFYQGWTEALPGRLKGTAPIAPEDLGLEVRKAGRTTGVTRGTITQVEVDRLRVDLGDEGHSRIALFSDQFEVQGIGTRPFSDGGDSGSLIIDSRGRARGLLFAGGPDEEGNDLTYANQIKVVLQKLGVTLVV